MRKQTHLWKRLSVIALSFMIAGESEVMRKEHIW